MPIRGRQDDHVALVAARSEENAVLRVQREAGASSALAGNIVFADHLHGVRINDRNGGLVFNVDVNLAVAVGGGLLGRAADVDGTEDRAILIVEDSDIWRRVAEDVEVVIVSV